MKKFIIIFLAIVALLPIRSMSADWTYSFVVYSGNIYEISSEELVPSNEIDKKIGQVTRYSDHEGTYSGSFSNTYLKERHIIRLRILIQKKSLPFRPTKLNLSKP